MIWTIEYDVLVQKEMRKIDPQTRQRIRAFLQERVAALDNPRQTGAALQGSELGNYWRYRVGDYRIICDIQDHKLVVLVVEIGHRREIYR
ncbi:MULTISPECIES: type II toxin-antitoxin system RelE/ParE family toxin [Rhizobium/Agrobacterium group]|uniref:Type II toxin-antitoxin system RelE/ParE family toxin n=2 Tax=Rhizobium/Agrobacterium group TaxID=227290 RepID=A0AA88JRR3_RHIRH|nr:MULTISPECIES: type II toxin-antitoxin system RelE/ParE family toxin [Rhizobium/Agrobacterium group]MBO0132589.1 type II toxin-antitoxin system RelE/ParE family toxin [Agrobacterium burrii]MQB08462.1 type II toxin-antitoxin system RelE/ParE family toxin [Agrobacterium sp. ICMP 6402]NTZ90094.1 type II toxin-antitoxin system RelE/ParE family toxin [Agrobacterium tumefaciens]KAA3502954.1 type II toxin-antitoxin system RelE/ParE family toxin [Rhizobium rhizogenes]MCZ7479404.1 type II toxin-antit